VALNTITLPPPPITPVNCLLICFILLLLVLPNPGMVKVNVRFILLLLVLPNPGMVKVNVRFILLLLVLPNPGMVKVNVRYLLSNYTTY
jgi:hypothetical protein